MRICLFSYVASLLIASFATSVTFLIVFQGVIPGIAGAFVSLVSTPEFDQGVEKKYVPKSDSLTITTDLVRNVVLTDVVAYLRLSGGVVR